MLAGSKARFTQRRTELRLFAVVSPVPQGVYTDRRFLGLLTILLARMKSYGVLTVHVRRVKTTYENEALL